jgi:hypothetical protein
MVNLPDAIITRPIIIQDITEKPNRQWELISKGYSDETWLIEGEDKDNQQE